MGSDRPLVVARLIGLVIGLLPAVAVAVPHGSRPGPGIVCVGVVYGLIGYGTGTAIDRRRSRRRGSLLVWRVAGGCLAALIVIVTFATVRGWTPSRVERTVNRALPPGTERARVEAFLNDLGWPHRRVEPIDGVAYMIRHANLDLDPAGLSGVVLADVPDPNPGLGGLDKGTITAVFFFDHDRRLVRSHVRVWILSL
jgi:hypothetical protein